MSRLRLDVNGHVLTVCCVYKFLCLMHTKKNEIRVNYFFREKSFAFRDGVVKRTSNGSRGVSMVSTETSFESLLSANWNITGYGMCVSNSDARGDRDRSIDRSRGSQ